MKIIKFNYESIALVECSCCQEDHTIRFDIYKDYKAGFDEDTLYIVIKDNSKYGFFSRINKVIYFMKNWKSFVDGNNIAWHGTLIHKKQLEELYPLLIDSLSRYNILTPADINNINVNTKLLDKKFPVTWTGKGGKKSTHGYNWVPFMADDFNIHVFGDVKDDKFVVEDNDICFGYNLSDATRFKDVWYLVRRYIFDNHNNFISGNFEGFLTKENTIWMLSTFKYFISNLKD